MKAQVSIYITVGVLLLIIAGVYFYLDQRREEIAPGVFVMLQNIPQELEPANSFITQCLNNLGEEALLLVGDHGGYISLDDREMTKNSFTITNNPTEGDGVLFAPESELKIPYWWYMQSRNECKGKCTFSSKKPALREEEPSIEKQLNRYLEQNLDSCFDGFDILSQEGFTVEPLGEIAVDTKIAENDVAIILKYPLRLSKGEVSAEIDQFFVKIPVDLNTIYDLATRITNLQQEYRFLERQTMNLIAAFSAIDEDKLPPLSDMRFQYGASTRWIKSDVKGKVGQMLSNYISMFQVDGSKNFNAPFFSSSLKQKLYEGMIIPGSSDYSQVEVSFSYLDFWPYYFDLNCRGEICEPESASSNLISLLPIGIHRYNFAYDLSYPVLVEIYDPNALQGRGYKFNFFLEANIRNNKELFTNFVPLESSYVPEFSQLCDLTNRNSGNVSVSVLDSVSKTPLRGVSVGLSVAGENCVVGTTNENGILKTRFPSGTAGAVVNLVKPEYIAHSQFFDAPLRSSASLSANLAPITNKKLIVRKKLVEKQGNQWTFTNRETSLEPNEEALVSLTRLSPESEDDFVSAVSVKGTSISELGIAPGTYELNINMFLRDNLIIPKRTIEQTTALFITTKYDLPGIEFSAESPYPSGGVHLNVTFTEEDLKKGSLVLYAISPALQFVPQEQRSIEDLEQSAKIDYYSQIFSPLLRPLFQ